MGRLRHFGSVLRTWHVRRRFQAAVNNAKCILAGYDPLIPTFTDQNPCAQSRIPMDMMRQG